MLNKKEKKEIINKIKKLLKPKGETKNLCAIDLMMVKPLIQLNQKHKVHSLKSVLYNRNVLYFNAG